MACFPVPPAPCRVRSCVVVLRHDRRRVAHFNVPASPSAAWTAQHRIEAVPFNDAPRFLLRENAQIDGDAVTRRVEHRDIDEVVTAPRSPGQNPYAARMSGTLRRACVDYVIVFSDKTPMPLLETMKPDVYAKGGDYTIDTIVQEERRLVEGYGGEIAIIPGIKGLSTTAIIDKIAKQ